MLKFYDYAITFAEFPDELALCVNITNCPGTCSDCSEPWLRENIGEELTEKKIDDLIADHPGITLFGLLGGDVDHTDIIRIANHIHTHYPNILIGMYSGLDYLNMDLLECLDYYKIGRWIKPEGASSEWFKTNNGPLQFPWSNQVLFKKVDNKWHNITNKFRKHKISNFERLIMTEGEEK